MGKISANFDVTGLSDKPVKRRYIHSISDPKSISNTTYNFLKFNEETLLTEIEKLHVRKKNHAPHDNKNIVICVTIFNEDFHSLQESLAGIISAKQYMSRKLKSKSADLIDLPSITICLVIDGLDKLSVGMASYISSLSGINVFNSSTEHDYMYCEGHLSDELFPIASRSGRGDIVGRCYGMPYSGNIGFIKNDLDYGKHRVILLAKKTNRGKLHSHWAFYNIVGQLEGPKYCIQLDVGVKPMQSSLYNLWSRMEVSNDAAAIAARSHVPSATNILNALENYQFCSFTYERILSWPIEDFVGYLSVLPGQMHMVRREALCSLPDVSSSFKLIESDVAKQYFKGMSDELSPFEANMYLAEDRIMGLGMVFDRGHSWHLEYCPTAEAKVDICGSWEELLKQRRRWICSGLTSRLWLIKKLINTSETQKPVNKHISDYSKALYFSLVTLMEVFSPALIVGAYVVLYNFLLEAVPENWVLQGAFKFGFGLGLASYLISAYLAGADRIGKKANVYISYAIYFQSLIMPLGLLFLITNTYQINMKLWTVIAISLMLLAIVNPYLYSIRIGHKNAISCLTYGFFKAPIELLLFTYAVLNIHNTSWGTKGLNKPDYKSRKRLDEFRNFRNGVVLFLLIINTSGGVGVVYLASRNINNLILSLVACSFFTMLLSYVAFFVKYRGKNYRGA